ncbi:MAG: hypothetical protein AAGC84_21390 [Pseudomonas sp.]
MRRLMFTSISLLTLGGCSMMPTPDPSQAWVSLRTSEANTLEAAKVDASELDDDRFFQVTPGQHELHMRLQFAVAPTNIGPDSQGLERTCVLKLDYPEFAAGQRYNLVAGSIGFRPWAKLYDQQHQLLARAKESRCGEV